MTKRSVKAILLSVTAMLAMSASARADVLFSNFGPGDSFDTGISWVVATPSSSIAINQNVAFAFTIAPGADYVFDSAELALQYFDGTNHINVQLQSDSGGIPGAVLESVDVIVPGGPSIVTMTSVDHTTLTAGSTYWISTEALGSFSGGWNFDNPSTTNGPIAFSFDDDATWMNFGPENDAALRVNGHLSSVPEPASAILIGLGAAVLGLRRFRRAKTVIA